MNHMRSLNALAVTIFSVLALTGCGDPNDYAAHDEGGEDESTPVATNRIAIPPAVRSNLGITFIEVERRRVERTLRVPGRFEFEPGAKREYRTPVAGQIELVVLPLTPVEAGDLLFRIDAPAWRELQQQIVEAELAIDQAAARLDTFDDLLAAHDEHHASLRSSVEVWVTRVERLEQLNAEAGGRIDELSQARAALTQARAELAAVGEKKATLTADEQQVRSSRRAAAARRDYLLDAAASITALSRDELIVSTDAFPVWQSIDRIEVRSAGAGVVSAWGLTNGAWADGKSSVVTVVQPDGLRFRATALQSDLGVLRDGLAARVVPPTPTKAGRAVPLSDTMTGTLVVGIEADPANRTIDLFVTPDTLAGWARPGVSAQLEIVTDGASREELAIPLAAVQRDGITPVIFRRAPDNPNEVIRLEADLGRSDGRWIELRSGVADGDEVVLDGSFQLMLASSGSIQQGGHFHADGTFHDGEH